MDPSTHKIWVVSAANILTMHPSSQQVCLQMLPQDLEELDISVDSGSLIRESSSQAWSGTAPLVGVPFHARCPTPVAWGGVLGPECFQPPSLNGDVIAWRKKPELTDAGPLHCAAAATVLTDAPTANRHSTSFSYDFRLRKCGRESGTKALYRAKKA